MSHDTAESLRRNAPRILAEWEVQAYKSVHSAYGLTTLVLNNSVDSFIEDIASALLPPNESSVAGVAENNRSIINFAKVHGGGRATEPLHYTLAEVILEFQLLEHVILDVLEEQSPIPIADRKIISNTIDKAMSAAATQFANVHQQIQEQYALMLVHDLRSPINFVKMAAYMIKRDSGASKHTLEVAGKIDNHMNSLESMLKELLDASKVRAGLGRAFKFEDIQLNDLAAEVVREVKNAHPERFELHLDEPVIGTWNRAGLRRVFENLIINALKYSSPNSLVKVTVAQNATHALFTVHNEGNPIPEDEQPRLFEQFHRASTSTDQTGWGLGLALVNGMVKAHRGTVRVESSQQTGTDFIVELPKKP